MLPENIDRDFFDRFSTQLNDICSPLQDIELDHFAHIRKYPDHSRVCLTNRSELATYYFQKKLYEHAPFERTLNNYNTCNIPWWDIDDSPTKLLRKQFKLSTGITLIGKTTQYCDFFHFASQESDPDINYFLTNNISLLEKFTVYYLSLAEDLIEEALKDKIQLPPRKDLPDPYVSNPQENLSLVTKSLDINTLKWTGNGETVMLTRRELECLYWCRHAKTAEEIAIITSLSKRTIEGHINNIKRKLNSPTLFTLGQRIVELGLNKIIDKLF